ncbi:thymidine kinase [Halobacteriales archaeon SW_6_65_15]|nr:MAG: thymidine kinase [Halobacteriales archaeon SW_6_65_15]
MHEITNSGWIEVITGCMFSGKTEELLRRLRRAEIAGQDVAVFKPSLDDRYGEETVGSHDGRQWEATVVDPEEHVWDVADELNGEEIVVSGTDQTFRGEPFEPLPRLVSLAEYVDKYQAICSQCGEPATRNQRLIDGEPAHVDDPTIMVGATESYEARCRNCHTLRTD